MSNINAHLENIKEYRIASHDIWEFGADERKRCLKLDWNEATIKPSPLVKERLSKLVLDDDIYNLYPNTYNCRLMKLLSEYVDLPENYIQYYPGSDMLHEYIAKACITKESKVLSLAPSYDNFRISVEASGAKIIYYECNNDFRCDEDTLIKFIENNEISFAYICNPNNPTGDLLDNSVIERLLIKFPDTIFFIDEAYYEFSGITVKDLALKYKNILISRTLSKAFGLANFRIGYLISHPSNISILDKIRNKKCVSTFAQEAAIAALEDVQYMKEYVESVKEAKEWFYEKWKKAIILGEIYWSHGNFFLIKCKDYKLKKEMLDFLRTRNIYLRDLTQSESVSNCIRITVGMKSQMQLVYEAIRKFQEKE